MEIIELERKEFIEFSKNYPYSTFFQSPHWIDVKKDNTTLLSRCGVFVDQKMPKITKPTIAEQRISTMGDSFLPVIFGQRSMTAVRMAVVTIPGISTIAPPDRGRALWTTIYTPMASTMPTTQGFSPCSTAWTYRFFMAFFRMHTISRITRYAASTTPTGATKLPQKPAWSLPM